MTIRLVNSVRTTAANGILTTVDAGTGAGLIKIYTGTVNASRGVAPSGTLLGTLVCSDPSFTVLNGVMTLEAVTSDDAVASGEAGCFTICDSDSNIVVDGSVSESGGGGDIILNTSSIVEGGPINMTGGTITIGV